MASEVERLARIEARVDGMYSEMQSMRKLMERQVRVEEQHARHAESIHGMGMRIERLESKISAIEQAVNRNHWTISRWERYIWLAVTSGLGLVLWHIKTGVGA